MSRTEKPSPNRADQPNPEWFERLDAYLAFDRDLDAKEQTRYAEDKDPEKGGQRGPIERHATRVLKLCRLFRQYECGEYQHPLMGQPILEDLSEGKEKAAFHAITEWLKAAPAVPRYVTPVEKRKLLQLRRRLDRAVADGLQALSGDTSQGRSRRNGSTSRAKTTPPQQAIIVSLGDRQYRIDDETIAVNFAEDGILQAFLKSGRRAMQKDQLFVATGKEDAPRILKRLKRNHSDTLGRGITLPDGKKNRGGYRVNIKAGK